MVNALHTAGNVHVCAWTFFYAHKEKYPHIDLQNDRFILQ